MIIRSLEDLQATGRYAEKPGVFTSARYLLREDRVGFTMTQTSVAAGTTQEMAYAHHVEANLVLDGEGVLTDLETGETHDLRPGVMYTFDGHERHRIDATTDLRIVCIFRPALLGTETHDETGAYPPAHVARWTGPHSPIPGRRSMPRPERVSNRACWYFTDTGAGGPLPA